MRRAQEEVGAGEVERSNLVRGKNHFERKESGRNPRKGRSKSNPQKPIRELKKKKEERIKQILKKKGGGRD